MKTKIFNDSLSKIEYFLYMQLLFNSKSQFLILSINLF